LFVAPDGERIYTWGESGAGRIWSRATGAPLPGPRIDNPTEGTWWQPAASVEGRWLAAAAGDAGAAFVWDLTGPVAAEPRALRRDARILSAAFHPGGSWLAVRDNRALTLWPLVWRHPQVLQAPTKALWALAVDPRGRWVAAAGEAAAKVWVWPLAPEAGAERATFEVGAPVRGLTASPRGDRLAAGTAGGLWLVPLTGAPQRLPGFEGSVIDVRFDAEGRRLAAGGVGSQFSKERLVRVWDLETRQPVVLDAGDAQPIFSVEFWPDGRLLSAGGAGARLWEASGRGSTVVLEGAAVARRSPDGRRLLGLRARVGPGGAVGTAVVSDIEGKAVRSLDAHGTEVTSIAWDPSGRLVVTGSRNGVVRVGPATGEEPHLLLGHEGAVRDVEVESGGQWVASTGEDGTVRLWPLPTEERPFHTLPYEELLGRLRSFTNFRVVPDPAAAGGYRLDFEPFTGWNRKPPSW
jgi:WD40 repeat protein